MRPNAAEIWLMIFVLAGIGWVAVGERRLLKVWLWWTAFCVVLFTLLLLTRGEPSLRNLVIAWALAPAVACLALARHALGRYGHK